MKELTKTAVDLINELELDNAEYYQDCKVLVLPARNKNESKMHLLVDGSTVENVICEKDWWNDSLCTDEYLEFFNSELAENNLVTAW